MTSIREITENEDGDPIWIFESAEAEYRCAKMLGLAKFNRRMMVVLAVGITACVLILLFAAYRLGTGYADLELDAERKEASHLRDVVVKLERELEAKR